MNYNHFLTQIHPGRDWDKNSPKELLQYALGAFLYTPALHKNIGRDICAKRYPQLKSICFCLEDAISDNSQEEAWHNLVFTLDMVYNALWQGSLCLREMPLCFVRIREPWQMNALMAELGERAQILSGFCLPKFDLASMDGYIRAFEKVHPANDGVLYLMPIIESWPVMNPATRMLELAGIKEALENIRPYVLNIRVGGNDFCSHFGLMRKRHQTIYQIEVVRDILKDLILAFGTDYVLSAPVWEYFGQPADTAWQEGLLAEIALDQLNGFIGKTAIHPAQLAVIQAAMMVDEEDYREAAAVLDWGGASAVAKNAHAQRMTEVKVRQRWARKTMGMAQIYGVRSNPYDRL